MISNAILFTLRTFGACLAAALLFLAIGPSNFAGFVPDKWTEMMKSVFGS